MPFKIPRRRLTSQFPDECHNLYYNVERFADAMIESENAASRKDMKAYEKAVREAGRAARDTSDKLNLLASGRKRYNRRRAKYGIGPALDLTPRNRAALVDAAKQAQAVTTILAYTGEGRALKSATRIRLMGVMFDANMIGLATCTNRTLRRR